MATEIKFLPKIFPQNIVDVSVWLTLNICVIRAESGNGNRHFRSCDDRRSDEACSHRQPPSWPHQLQNQSLLQARSSDTMT